MQWVGQSCVGAHFLPSVRILDLFSSLVLVWLLCCCSLVVRLFPLLVCHSCYLSFLSWEGSFLGGNLDIMSVTIVFILWFYGWLIVFGGRDVRVRRTTLGSGFTREKTST